MPVGLPVTRSGSILDRQEANGHSFGGKDYGFFAAVKRRADRRQASRSPGLAVIR
jgi:hypothetical protein